MSFLPSITTAFSQHAARAAIASENARMGPLAHVSPLAAILGTRADWTDSFRRLQVGPAWTAGLTAEALSQHWNTILGPIQRIFENGGLFSPAIREDIERFQERMRQLQEIADVQERAKLLLIESGFEFLIPFPFLSLSTLRGLVSFTAVKTRQASVAKKILAITRSREFENDFIRELGQSKRLARRAKVLNGSYRLHLKEEYELSIPVLYAQFEGLYTELMQLSGMAGRKKGKKGKFYAKGQNGKLLLGGDDKAIELRGLDKKADHSRIQFDNHPRMERIPYFIRGGFAQSRNGVLHGVLVNYGTAKQSTQLLLLVFLVAREINRLEYSTLAQAA